MTDRVDFWNQKNEDGSIISHDEYMNRVDLYWKKKNVVLKPEMDRLKEVQRLLVAFLEEYRVEILCFAEYDCENHPYTKDVLSLRSLDNREASWWAMGSPFMPLRTEEIEE